MAFLLSRADLIGMPGSLCWSYRDGELELAGILSKKNVASHRKQVILIASSFQQFLGGSVDPRWEGRRVLRLYQEEEATVEHGESLCILSYYYCSMKKGHSGPLGFSHLTIVKQLGAISIAFPCVRLGQ